MELLACVIEQRPVAMWWLSNWCHMAEWWSSGQSMVLSAVVTVIGRIWLLPLMSSACTVVHNTLVDRFWLLLLMSSAYAVEWRPRCGAWHCC